MRKKYIQYLDYAVKTGLCSDTFENEVIKYRAWGLVKELMDKQKDCFLKPAL